MKIWNMCTACFNTYISEPEYAPDPEDEPIVLVSTDLLPGPITVEKYQFALSAIIISQSLTEHGQKRVKPAVWRAFLL